MKRIRTYSAVLAAALCCGPAVFAQQAEPSPQVGDLIFARRNLMLQSEVYMVTIENYAAAAAQAGSEVPFEAAEAADNLSSLLLAVPHLFPEGTDYWSEAAEAADPTAVTLALPAVWDDFDTFFQQSQDIAQLAFDLSRREPRDAAWRQKAADSIVSAMRLYAEARKGEDG